MLEDGAAFPEIWSTRAASLGSAKDPGADPTEVTSLTVRTRSSGDLAALEQSVQDLYQKPLGERQYLSREELAQRHGARAEDFDAIEAYAQQHNLMVSHRNAAERTLVGNAKKLALFAAGAASQKYMQALVDQQEIMGAIADIVIEVYAMESALLRTMKTATAQGEAAAVLPIAMMRLYCAKGMEKIESAARQIITAVAEGDMLRTQLAILRRLAKHDPYNTIGLEQEVAHALVERGRYPRD